MGRWASFRNAFRGIRFLLATQPNSRIHAAATLAVVILAVVLGVSRRDWLWLVAAIALVWMAEAFNTAVELLGDVASAEPHPVIGRAKDVSAAGVLLAAMGASIIGVIIFLPHVLN